MEEFMGLRIYRDGRVERWFKRKGWTIVENVDNNKGYNRVTVDDKYYYRHRLVVAAFNKQFDINNTEHHIDHKDGNRLNNAFGNLRVVTQQGNNFNNHVAKGYCWCRAKGKWQAQIRINNKKKHLGYFDTQEEARVAYLTAKAEHHVIVELC